MELMSTLLFCAFLALLPQAPALTSSDGNYAKERYRMAKKLLLNLNGIPLVHKTSPLQGVFMDTMCTNCTECMERTIQAFRHYKHIYEGKPSAEDLHLDIISQDEEDEYQPRRYRYRRDLLDAQRLANKFRKSKRSKSVTVTKYYKNGKVSALKVVEANTSENDNRLAPNKNLPSCRVYKVKKYIPCGSVESNAVLEATKRELKTNDAPKMSYHNALTDTGTKTHMNKLQIDRSQLDEQYLPSIDLY